MKFPFFRERPPGMSKWILGFLILGFFLRAYHFAQFPVFGETRDEIAWTMQGASLLQTGTPQSWSYFASYINARTVILGSSEYRLVTPTVDHPPLFGLIPGFFSTIQGAEWDELPSAVAIRAPMVLVSGFNLILFAWMARRWLGDTLSEKIAVALFAITPSWIFLQRLAVSESLLITWILVILLAVTWPKIRAWTWLGSVSLVALPLTKVSGLAVVAGVIVAQWGIPISQRFRSWSLAAVAGVASVLSYVALVDWSLFWQVQAEQSQRDTGLLTLFSTQLWSQSLVLHHFADPWILLGFGCCLVLIVIREAKFLSLKVDQTAWNTFRAVFLAQLAFILMSVGEHTTHGWYRIVFFPLFAMAFGIIGQWLWKSRSLFGLAALWLVLAVLLRQGLWFAFGPLLYEWQSAINKVWLLLCGSVVAAEFMASDRLKSKIFTIGCLVLVAVVILSSVSTIVNITQEKYWQDDQYLQTGLRS